MNSRTIVVIGSSNLDRVMTLLRLPVVGETVSDGVYQQVFGGKGANQAVAAARAGGQVVFLNAVGDDAEGAAMRTNLVRDGIDTSRMVTIPNIASGTALILVDAAGRNCIAVAPGANHALTPEHIRQNADTITGAAYIVMQMEIPAETVQAVLEIGVQASVPVLLNFAPARSLEVPISAAVNGLVVNETEAEALTGIVVTGRESAQIAGEMLLFRGPRYVIITLGADGALVLESGGAVESVAAFPVKPVDTTAAGDTFCGALVARLVEGEPLIAACRFASAAAALSVMRAGAQPSVPHRATIEAFLASAERK